MDNVTDQRKKCPGTMFDEAMKLRDENKLVESRALLLSIVEQLNPEESVLLSHSHIQLGYIAELLGDHKQREPHFRAAVAASPNNELASLGLFHALFALGRYIEAHREMVRLLRQRYSKMYDKLLTPKYDLKFRGELRGLTREARALLAKRWAAKLRRN